MSDHPEVPDDFEPTLRIDREQAAEDTATRRMTPPPAGERKKSAGNPSGMTGRFLAQLSGIFRRRGGNFEPVPLHSEHRYVSLESAESASFPPLEKAFERAEEIGAGGQARLYRGFDLNLRRQVAVKSLREELGRDPEFREKFIAEAMITAQLDHPAIVPVYSIHHDGKNNLHLAMKLINGRPFQTYLAELVRHYERAATGSSSARRTGGAWPTSSRGCIRSTGTTSKRSISKSSSPSTASRFPRVSLPRCRARPAR